MELILLSAIRLLYQKHLSAKFREQSLSQVLELMHRISLINYSIKDSNGNTQQLQITLGYC